MITISAWISAQGIKLIAGIIRERRINFRWFIGYGGMPSSHAAGGASLATSCGILYGFDSGIFGVATVFALVLMFDAQGVRRAAGQQATILNQILDDMYSKGTIEEVKLKELLGHTPVQVFAGALLGILIAAWMCHIWV